MTTHKGIAPLAVLLIIGVLAVLGGGAYVVLSPKDSGLADDSGFHPPVDNHEANADTSASGKIGITWKFNDMDFDANNTPHTEVTAVVKGKEYVIGTFEGSCAEVGASGGIDGKGLLAGELSAAQCWFAGGGDEIGVFAHEDGGYQIMVGSLAEPDGEGAQGFRGDFKIKVDIPSTVPAGAL